MNKFIIAAIALAGSVFSSCAGNKTESAMETEDSKVLVAYYSETGTTEAVAKEIASATDGQLLRIVPEEPYTAADLDWRDNNSRSSIEMNDRKSRPAIKDGKVDLDNVDVVFIGYPIWWDQAPRVINTFIEENDLAGKKIVTFCTSGETSIDGSTRTLKEDYPSLDIIQGKRLNGATKTEIESWIKSLAF